MHSKVLLSLLYFFLISAKKQIDKFLEPDTFELTCMASQSRTFDKKYQALTEALGKVLDDYSLVKYFPLDISNEDNISDLSLMIDQILQVGEDADVKVTDFENEELGDNDDE